MKNQRRFKAPTIAAAACSRKHSESQPQIPRIELPARRGGPVLVSTCENNDEMPTHVS